MTFEVNRFTIGLFLTILLCHEIRSKPLYYPAIDIPQYIMDETETMDDAMYSDVKRYPEKNPAFLANWPYLRELLPPNDFGGETQLSLEDEGLVVPEVIPTPLPLQKKHPTLKNSLKDHGKKKNQYHMSPCLLKVCIYGRKRNTRHMIY